MTTTSKPDAVRPEDNKCIETAQRILWLAFDRNDNDYHAAIDTLLAIRHGTRPAVEDMGDAIREINFELDAALFGSHVALQLPHD
jgi:hypothetical protein